MKTIKMIVCYFSEIYQSSKVGKSLLILTLGIMITFGSITAKNLFGLKPELNLYLIFWFIIPAIILILVGSSIGDICDEVCMIIKSSVKKKTPDEKLEGIRKTHDFINLVRFYSYTGGIISVLIFFWWLVKQVRIEPINPERIVCGYLVEFSIISIVILIFYFAKGVEKELHKDWHSAFREKVTL